MDKLTMAHEFAMKQLENSKGNITIESLKSFAWEYTDAMQSEADKRNQDSRSLTKDQEGNCLHFHHEFGHKKCMDCGDSLDDWQPDWSQAPEWANYWCMQAHSGWCYWIGSQPTKKWDQFRIIKNEPAPTFNYQGDWKDSLRKRPG